MPIIKFTLWLFDNSLLIRDVQRFVLMLYLPFLKLFEGSPSLAIHPRQTTERVLAVLLLWYLSTLIIALGLVFSSDFVTTLVAKAKKPSGADYFVEATYQMDACNYRDILLKGYNFQADQRSNVAFFPAYPMCCKALQFCGLSLENAMLVISNVFFLGGCFILGMYGVNDPRFDYDRTGNWHLALFCLFPAGFFLRMPYAESLLCFIASLTLLGILRKWPLVVLVFLAGIATATRPVGLAVSAAVLWHFLATPDPNILKNDIQEDNYKIHKRKLLSLLWLIPISCWGLLVYIGYLWWKFDTPLAFAQTQSHWIFQSPINGTFGDKVWSLVTLEPMWGVYDPDSSRYWLRGDTQTNPLFSCLFWNPIFYLSTWVLIILGCCKRWLTGPEIVLSLGLLIIPYVTRAYEMSMASHARFAAVVIPQYFVLGRLFSMMPPAIAGCLSGLMGFMLGIWTALFVAGYRFF